MRLLAELQRRNVIRMAGLYLVGAWLLVQVASVTLPAFGVPDWVLRAVIILLALGFVPALVFAWVYELTPEGLKRDHEVAPAHSIAAQTGRRMDRLLAVGLVAVVAVVAADRLWPREEEEKTGSESLSGRPAPAGASALAPESDSDPGFSSSSPKSIAVLAFADLSPGKDQEYFSDGIAEEILNSLARIPGLKVAGRTSSFHFKGRNEDLRTIGTTLGVAHVLEGSVRKQGDKVRITAQLIQAADGFHVWSQTYDGDLSDVFELQERIARAITDALKVVLQGDPQRRLVQVGTTNAEAYALYLQATAIFNRRDLDHIGDAVASLEEATRLDPSFARGYARLASLLIVKPRDPQSRPAAERYANQAIALDGTLAEPHAVLALAFSDQRRYRDARAALERALELEPDDPTSNFWFGITLIATGYKRDGIARLDRALEIDPLLPNALHWRGLEYAFAGNHDLAQRLTQRAADLGLTYASFGQAQAAWARGDFAQAVDYIQPRMIRWRECGGESDEAVQAVAAAVYGNDASARATALVAIDRCVATRPVPMRAHAPMFLLRLGEPARALELTQAALTDNETFLLQLIWSPHGAAARRLPQFAEFARRMGLADLWDAHGAPDGCRRVAPRDYACD